MQLAAAWRVPLARSDELDGRRRPRRARRRSVPSPSCIGVERENPTAPLSHHIFDSTHIVEGVVLGRRGSADRCPSRARSSAAASPTSIATTWISAHSTRGPLACGCARIRSGRYRRRYGFLHEPEQLEPGDQRRTNASVSWFRQRENGYSAVTAAVGWNASRSAPFMQSSSRARITLAARRSTDASRTRPSKPKFCCSRKSSIGRIPARSSTLSTHSPREPSATSPPSRVTLGVGGDVTFYQLPPLLQITHEPHPVSFHVFLRDRARVASGSHVEYDDGGARRGP